MYEYVVLIISIVAILSAILFAKKVLSLPEGEESMIRVARAIQEGAKAYMNRQYRTVLSFAIVLAIILSLTLGWKVGLGFILGSLLSAIAGYTGMNVSIRANVRTTYAAREGLLKALRVAILGGAVTGLGVVGLALLGMSAFYIIFRDLYAIVGFAFGASLVSLFARIGGGIYTKAADVGADLVGKVEKGIPEDDPRNPAVIADQVGDNVGDCAGMGADLFETYAVTTIGAMVLAWLLFNQYNYVIYPLLLGAIAIIATLISIPFIRTNDPERIAKALYIGLLINGIVAAIGFLIITKILGIDIRYFYTALIGLAITLAIFALTEYYTGFYRPVIDIARSSITGAGTNLIMGISVGLESTFLPALVIVIGIISSYLIGGLYGVAIAVMAMISLTGMILTLDTYGPITDNAAGIAEMSGQGEEIRRVTDALDAVGNTTKAVTKGFAIGSAALAALVFFAAYLQEVAKRAPEMIKEFMLNDVYVLAGIFIGAMIPFIFSALAIRAVSHAAFEVVNEVRRQFREKPGILEWKEKPEYGRCVDIVTKYALKKMSQPISIAILGPVATGLILGEKALGGLLIGSIASGLLLALFMANGGGAWDNAKKYIELGNFGGKRSDAHKAAVIGDTVGDPLKDTAGPAINPLIKVINTLALLLVPIIL